MDGEKPVGGAWNFDIENRKSLPDGRIPPKRKRFSPDTLTRAVISLVDQIFESNFGDLTEFGWPVTRQQALIALDDFIIHLLPDFGAYQDAMKQDAPFLYHSLIAPALNIGL